jgi:FMNH2-dependent dimethyl sulfone monooxygenase
MRYGVWTPLPHTIRPEPLMDEAIRDSSTPGFAPGPDKAFRFAVDVLQRGEELGFESTLIAERWMGTDLSAWMLGAALAPLTRRMELMVAVHPGVLTPQAVAKLAVSLDRISGGRAAINLVNGWWKEEFETFGQTFLPIDDTVRYRRMDEFVRVMRGMWLQDKFDFHGEFYNVDGQSLPLKPVHRPHPPLYAGTRNDFGKDVIARDCDYWFVDYVPDHRVWQKNIEQAHSLIDDMRGRAARHGRSVRFGMSCHVICADSMERSIELADQLEEHGKTNRIAFIAARALGPGLVGTPQVIAERVSLLEAAGVDTLMLHFHPMMEGMERFAGQVMPLLQKQAA